MRRIGHRGAKGHALENTLAAFDKAIELGCDEIETDVWSIDDALVISHDRPRSSDGLLTLDEALDHCRGRIPVNLELKSGGSEAHARATGERVARRLAERNDADVYVSSFWWSTLMSSRDVAPHVRRAFIYGASPDWMALRDGARALGLWALHPEHWYVTPDLVRAAHAESLRVIPWTVNDPDRIRRLASWDVDGIVSDFPERIPK